MEFVQTLPDTHINPIELNESFTFEKESTVGLRNTYKHKFGPFTINFNKKFGPTSFTMRMFGVTYRIWSKRDVSGVASVDLPGPWSYRTARKSKAVAAREKAAREQQAQDDANNVANNP